MKKLSDTQMIVATAKDNVYLLIAGTYDMATTGTTKTNSSDYKKPVSNSTSTIWSVDMQYLNSIDSEKGQVNITKLYPDGIDFTLTNETKKLDDKAYFHSDNCACYKENVYDLEITRNDSGVIGIVEIGNQGLGIEESYSAVHNKKELRLFFCMMCIVKS